jgi:ferrous iron transport protein B
VQQRDPKLQSAVREMVSLIEREYPGLPNASWVALRLIDGDKSIEQAVRNHTLGALSAPAAPARPARNTVPVEALAS